MTRRRAWRREALVVAAMGGGLFLVSLVPYLVAYANAPSGSVFNGFFYIADDATTYISKMREGADGLWGWRDPYISAPVAQPVGLFLFYLMWGKLAGLLHLSMYTGFHLARLSGALALVGTVRALARAVLPAGRARLVGVGLALLGGGLAWLTGVVLAFSHHLTVLGDQIDTLDLRLPELSGFYSIIAIPHFAWAAALMAFAVLAIIRVVDLTANRLPVLTWVASLAVALLVLCAIHPQMLFVLAVLALSHLLLARARRSAWLALAAPFLLCAPPTYYLYRVLVDDPVVRQWSQQWKHQAPGPISLALALGIPLGLAVVGALRSPRRADLPVRLMATWLGLVLVLLYLPNPVNIQRRLIDGIYIPVAFLGALGFEWLAARGPARKRLPGRLVLALALSGVSSLLVLAVGMNWAVTRDPLVYVDGGEIAAVDWLSATRAAGLPPAVLSSPDTGLYIPARAGDRVFVGHYSETLNFFSRRTEAVAALRGGGQPLVEFMRAEGISILVVGPLERRVGAVDPSGVGGLRLVYDHNGVQVYALNP